jgi:FAD/FMN-containing dehydrogenase
MTSALQQPRQRQAYLDEQRLGGIRAAVRGQVCLKGSPGYDEARTIWNAMIDRYPDVAIRCAETADVVQAVRFANEHDLAIAVRGGGHNIAGNAVGDGGLLIDLSPMKMVKVDAQKRTASVGPGATLADVDKATQAFGLALPTGINSTTGIAGLTLGGGFGWLTRPFGMTIDNLVSVDVVTAKGELVRAGGSQNEDLFWAIRGGGGNFGVVTNFEFRLHPVGPQVFSGLIVHPFANAKELLKGYREVVAKAPTS